MTRVHAILLTAFVAVFIAISGWMLWNAVSLKRETFVSGRPPEDVRKVLLPKQVDLELMRPPAIRTTDPMRYGNDLSAGSVVEYGDFQCDACRSMRKTLENVIPQYNGKIRLVWRDLPITDAHPQAMNAAVFARCAGFQGKFWEAHDALFDAETLNESTYAAITRAIRLDADQMAACRQDAAVRAAIEDDVKAARNDGVNSTPLIFVGTQAKTGSMTEQELHEAIRLFLAS
jgi:protein-disulfide isomerase